MKKTVLFGILTLMIFNTAIFTPKAEAKSNLIRVGLNYRSTSITDETELKTNGKFILPDGTSTEGHINLKAVPFSSSVEICSSDGHMLESLSDGNSYAITADNGVITVNGRGYRGTMEIWSEGGKIKLINVLPLDHYLYSVLPSEIYPSWGEEALKTTAVAARSFCLANISGKHNSDGFDVCATTHCQMYKGANYEDSRTSRAVDETSGEVLTYGGKIISAMYSANNGGYTEGTENIWTAKLPYYVSKPDPYTPEDIWQVTYTPEEVEEKLKERGEDIGKVTDIVIEKTAKSGRVTSLTIIGTLGRYNIKKDAIRSLFNLRSTMFTVEKTGTKTSSLINAIKTMEKESGVNLASDYYTEKETVFLFDGMGFGHGAGISQWGCKYMADIGKTYREILEYYYEGTQITNIN